MKKKIVFSLGLMVLVAIFCSNIKLCHEASLKTITLNSIGLWSTAQAENGTTTTKCQGTECDYANGHYYKTWTKNDGSIICCGTSTTTDRGCKTSS